MTARPFSVIERLRIFEVRQQAVVLDSDLAASYGVPTGAFNQAIKRNFVRFPDGSCFQLTKNEFEGLMPQIVVLKGCDLRSHSVTSSWPGRLRSLARVFTGLGVSTAVRCQIGTLKTEPRPGQPSKGKAEGFLNRRARDVDLNEYLVIRIVRR